MDGVSFFYYLLTIFKNSPEIAPIIALIIVGVVLWRYSYIPALLQNLKKNTEDNKAKIALIDKLEGDLDKIRNEIVPSSAFKSERNRLDEISKELANLRGAFESTKDGLEKAIENLSKLLISFMNKR